MPTDRLSINRSMENVEMNGGIRGVLCGTGALVNIDDFVDNQFKNYSILMSWWNIHLFLLICDSTMTMAQCVVDHGSR